jgi:5-formyltetrahydrofolate cyclo-ligase
MNSEPALAKHELRQKLRAMLKALPDEEGRAASLRASALLRQQAVWNSARAVLFYAPLAGEIDLSSVLDEGLRAGKAIALPRFIRETGAYDVCQIRNVTGDCAPGKFGIAEPTAQCAHFPLKHLDLVLAPGVGFDVTGCRLGRGRGFYDRLLAQISGIKCGVALDQQIVAQIPGEKHDVRMNCILTPTRWLEISE